MAKNEDKNKGKKAESSLGSFPKPLSIISQAVLKDFFKKANPQEFLSSTQKPLEKKEGPPAEAKRPLR